MRSLQLVRQKESEKTGGIKFCCECSFNWNWYENVGRQLAESARSSDGGVYEEASLR